LRAALTCPKVTSEKGEKSSKAFIASTCARAEPHETSFAKPKTRNVCERSTSGLSLHAICKTKTLNISSLIVHVPRQSSV
jgi:hypothetical protein